MPSGFVGVLISRLRDHTPLCSFTEASFSDEVGQQQEKIVARMKVPNSNAASSLTGPSKSYTSFDDKSLTYFVLTDIYSDIIIVAAVNKLMVQSAHKITCKLLDAVYDEFLAAHSREQISVSKIRPYQFINFDSTLQKTINRVVMGDKKAGGGGHDTVTRSGTQESAPYDAIKQEINDVHVVIRQNLDDLLTRGEKLDTMSQYGEQLKDYSGKYYKRTVHMNRMRILKTYGPPVAIVLFILTFLWIKYWW